jgi:hypothetical protein
LSHSEWYFCVGIGLSWQQLVHEADHRAAQLADG